MQSYFSMRPPSANWEQLPLSDLPGAFVWVWYKPPHCPYGAMFQIPQPVLMQFSNLITVRRLLLTAQLHPAEVSNWALDGMTYDTQQGMNPLLDYPIPNGPRAGECIVTIQVTQAVVHPLVTHSQVAIAPTMSTSSNLLTAVKVAGQESHYMAIETDWQAVIQIEKQIDTMRKQLNAAQSRLQSLNRDLSTDERQAADSLDLKDWSDARRFIRDSLSHLSRYVRECDMGITSGAGNRNRLHDLYTQSVVPRLPIQNIVAVQNDFEIHRKIAHTLVVKMNTVMSNSSNNAEQRAQQILARISAKARKARSKK